MVTGREVNYSNTDKVGIPNPENWGSYIHSLVSAMETKYKQRNTRIREVRDRRYWRKIPVIPDKFKATATAYRGSQVFDMIRRSESLMDGMPEPHVSRLSGEEAERRESFMIGFYEESGLKKIYGKIKDSLFGDGGTCWKILCKSDEYLNTPQTEGESSDSYNNRVKKHRETHFPFTAEHIPFNCFHPITNDEILEITERETLPLMRQYGVIYSNREFRFGNIVGSPDIPPTGSAPRKVKWVEYWNDKIYVYMLGNLVVEAGEHEYGRHPYFFAHSMEASTGDPADECISIATPLVYIQDLIDAFITIQMNWAFINGFPQGRMTPTSDDAAEISDTDTVVWEPGGILDAPGRKFEWVQAPNIGQDVKAIIEFLKGEADVVSLAPILYGIAGANTSSTMATSLIAIAKSIFSTGTGNIASAFDDTAAFVLNIIENKLHAPVYVYRVGKKNFVSLSPDEINGYYKFEHTYEPQIAAERATRATLLADAHARDAIPMRLYVEEGLGYEDPAKLMRERKVEDYTKRADYANRVIQEAFRLIGLELQPQQQQPTAIPAAPGGPGVPMIPGIQLPMQGMSSQTQPNQIAPVPTNGAQPVPTGGY